jgi:voltage-gated potassium channel
MHFGFTVANFVAIYACLFTFFHDANFRAAPWFFSIGGLALPVIAFLVACLARRREIAAVIHARRTRALEHLPRLSRWVPGTIAIGLGSFALPDQRLEPLAQGVVLIGAMAIIAILVVFAVRDVVLLMVDVSQILEAVTGRIQRLVIPMVAFVTLYMLLVVMFGCLYRIADISLGSPPFAVHGQAAAISFTDAIYFSFVTISTMGYGDIVAIAPLARALVALEMLSGLLLLLFGFSEIMRIAVPQATRPHGGGRVRRSDAEPESKAKLEN